jgi:hypothetical protein
MDPSSKGRGTRVALVAAGSVAFLTALIYVPPVAGFVLAVAAAGGWCAWLEHHPAA